MTKKLTLLFIAITALFSCENHKDLPNGLFAEIKTDKGDLIVQLDYENAPVTVANFVSLAEGKNPFVNEDLKGKPLYDGLKFHRVIKDFMIQGGDPLGNGSGDAGYAFKDEITDARFDKEGILAMANAGPGTNGTQFFITHVATPWLDGKHTIFGHVVENGMDVVNKIEQDDMILSITIIRKGDAAKKFNAVKVFGDYFKTESENVKNRAEIEAKEKELYEAKYKPIMNNKVAYFKNIKATATKTNTGLEYKIVKKGSGKRPKIGVSVWIDYAGYFENGALFDSSIESISKTYGKYDQARAAQNGYTPIPFRTGTKEGMIPGFLEAIEKMELGDKLVVFIPSHLAYGEAGAGNGIIPPNANLIFEIELKETQR
ncbi:MAG: peptidylprolyl isomerase [Flavobacterium sp.]